MTFKIHLLFLVLSLTSISACTISEASSETRQEIVFDDGKNEQNNDEIVITDADLNQSVLENPAGKKSQEQTLIAEDQSKITTMIDTYGNKTETRCFSNHPRLDCISVVTSADGKKETTIYPIGSGAKIMPENTAERALTDSPDELANLAGAYITRDDVAKKPVSPYGGKNDSANLQPLPSSAFPVLPKQISPASVEDTFVQTEENPPIKDSANPNPELEN